MKKFFMAGTDDELKFGDMIEVDLVKETKSGGIKHQYVECKFSPLIVDMLLENDIIEEREVKGNTKGEKSCDKIQELEDRVTELEGVVAGLMDKRTIKFK